MEDLSGCVTEIINLNLSEIYFGYEVRWIQPLRGQLSTCKRFLANLSSDELMQFHWILQWWGLRLSLSEVSVAVTWSGRVCLTPRWDSGQSLSFWAVVGAIGYLELDFSSVSEPSLPF